MPPPKRDFSGIAAGLVPSGPCQQRMRAVVDALWAALHDKGVSWVGLYLDQPGKPDDQRLVLGPCRDKPACSPIGLHGVCGQALRFRTTRIVRNVRELDDDYVACDPRDRSEIAVPLIDETGAAWAVLDLDSHEIAAFDDSDERGLRRVLEAAGLLLGVGEPPLTPDS